MQPEAGARRCGCSVPADELVLPWTAVCPLRPRQAVTQFMVLVFLLFRISPLPALFWSHIQGSVLPPRSQLCPPCPPAVRRPPRRLSPSTASHCRFRERSQHGSQHRPAFLLPAGSPLPELVALLLELTAGPGLGTGWEQGRGSMT